MSHCKICEKSGDISLLLAHHKELGNIYVCQECWTKLYDKNSMITSGTGSCGPCSSTGPCRSCSR
ncbi:MAG TPA: hypothetical protein VMV49_12085 [Candidatus Deferrimicrobium sp.]|nr:hypothetical protein [Candidatus Deferrimicrobium sp.]